MTNDEFLSKYVFKELTEEVLAECEHLMSTRKDKAIVPQTTYSFFLKHFSPSVS